MDAVSQVAEALARAHRSRSGVFILTGAGMSAESGLPTFRGVDGYWGRYRVEDLASAQGFARDPLTVWRWYNERIAAYGDAAPNAGHYALAELGSLVDDVTIATQNVDSLHQRAGSRGVLELHGNLREARCTTCGASVPIDRGLSENRIDHECGGRFRAHRRRSIPPPRSHSATNGPSSQRSIRMQRRSATDAHASFERVPQRRFRAFYGDCAACCRRSRE